MRDVLAGVVAVVLLFVAASLATTLTVYRRRRRQARERERAQGRSIVAEIPGHADLVLFTEDASSFHYGGRTIDKPAIVAVRVLINGVPIAEARRTSAPAPAATKPAALEYDEPEGIARDRWDVAIETRDNTTVVECGAIRERVSQELARAVFDAVKRAVESP